MGVKIRLQDAVSASVLRKAQDRTIVTVEGIYIVECFRKGRLLWKDDIHNVVTDVGVHHILDNYLEGSTFSQVGPFLGLIASGTAPVVGDTMASHAGWTESGGGTGPTWDTPASSARVDCSAGFNAAASRTKALTTAAHFVLDSITNGAVLKGAFMVCGTGAVATNNSTAGTLLSAGFFTGGDKSNLQIDDEINVSWSLEMAVYTP